MTNQRGTDVRCERHKIGEVTDGMFQWKCRQCTQAEGRPVLHTIPLWELVRMGFDARRDIVCPLGNDDQAA